MALPTSHTSFELEIFPRPTESLAQNDVNIQEPEIGGHLDPTDGGSSAWKLLIAAFVFEGVLYGAKYFVTSLRSDIEIDVLKGSLSRLVSSKITTLAFLSLATVHTSQS
jgi:hypothetical protein